MLKPKEGFTPHNNCDKTNSILHRFGFKVTNQDESSIGNFTHKLVKNRNRSYVSGFSLIEMLVVMSITLVLSAILIGYARESGRQMLLISSQAKIVNLISRAKSLSVATFIDEKGLPVGSDALKICGYGVHVDKDLGQVFIFRDLAVDCSADDPARRYVYDDKDDVKLTSTLDVFSVPDTIVQFGDDTTLIDVLFIPPDPTIVVNANADPSLQSAKVTLQSKDKALNFLVKIDNAGKISTK